MPTAAPEMISYTIRRYLAAADNTQAAAIRPFLASDFQATLPDIELSLDRDGYEQAARAYYVAFPDLQHTIEAIDVAGDEARVQLTLIGTQRGDLPDLPASGKTMRLSAAALFRLRGSQIISLDLRYDPFSMLEQLAAF